MFETLWNLIETVITTVMITAKIGNKEDSNLWVVKEEETHLVLMMIIWRTREDEKLGIKTLQELLSMIMTRKINTNGMMIDYMKNKEKRGLKSQKKQKMIEDKMNTIFKMTKMRVLEKVIKEIEIEKE